MSEPNKGIAEELIDGQSKTDAEEGNELTCPARPPHWKMKFIALLVGMLTLVSDTDLSFKFTHA